MSTVSQHPAPTARLAAEQSRSGDRFVATCLILKAAVLLGYQPLAGELVTPLLVTGSIFLVLGLAVARWRPRWLLILIAVLVALNVIGSMQFILAGIQHPESVLSFLVDVLAVLASLAAIAGVVVALRRGAQPGGRRPIAVVVGGLAVAAVVVSVAASAQVAADPAQSGDVPVEVVGFHFPDSVRVPAGGGVLWVDNQDPVRHTLVVEGTDVHVELPASTSVRAAVDLAPGTYRYFCDVPGHERMEGELHVR